MKTKMFFLLFISIFYLVGFYLFGQNLREARRSLQAAAWPTTPGTITALALDEDNDSDGTTYAVKVQYSYTVGGVAYEGSRLAYGYGYSSGKGAHKEIHYKLRGVKSVAVRYDPANPAEACLAFGLHRSLQFGLAFSLTWLLFVFGFTAMFWIFSRGDNVLLETLSVR